VTYVRLVSHQAPPHTPHARIKDATDEEEKSCLWACGWVVHDCVWMVVRSAQYDPNPEFAKENGGC